MLKKPTEKDLYILKCDTDQTRKGAYDVESVLENADPTVKGTYIINHKLNVAIKYLSNDIKAEQGFKKDVEVSKIIAR